jgi:hypothetical protein
MARIEPTVALEMFVEKANELDRSRFFRGESQIGALITFDRLQGWDGVYVGPDDDNLKAVVLTLRMFIQDNEAISLRNMRRMLAGTTVRPELVAQFDAQCKVLNDYLDSETNLAISEAGPLTHRDVLNMFVYGSYAHLNQGHRATLASVSQAEFFPLFQLCLADILLNCRRALLVLRDVSAEVHKSLSAPDAV